MFTSLKNAYSNSVKNFHNDEDGVEAIQAVVILAIGGIALITVKDKWKDIKTFFDNNVKDATSGWSWQSGGGGGAG